MRWRRLGRPLAALPRQGWWIAGGIIATLVATAGLCAIAAIDGSRAQLSASIVVLVIGSLILDLAGAIILARAWAYGRTSFLLAVPFFYLWPLLAVGVLGITVASAGDGGGGLFFPTPRGGERYRQSRRGRKRRASSGAS